MSKVLVVDDEHAICKAFAQMLEQSAHQALIASSGLRALEILGREQVDLVFLDVRMPGMDGIEALKRIRAGHPELPVIVMTAYGTMETAMQALELGAFDYLGKPLDLKRIGALLARALHRPEQHDSVAAAPAPAEAAPDATQMVGQSAAMQEVFKRTALLAANDLPVLITGESGVGKEVLARAVHRYSRSRNAPFIAVNCAAIPEQLLESELFGHERGAFTGAAERRIGRFEAADGGVVFLDEIGELSLPLQAKLLRVLQERTFERVGSNEPLRLQARVIAATNRDLADASDAGAFRKDLYHRLDVFNLHIPPLRRRRGDVAPLALHFLTRAAAELDKPIGSIEALALRRLEAYAWPGNVRELEHVIKRSVLMARGPVLAAHDLDLPAANGDDPPQATPLEQLGRAARAALHAALEAPNALSAETTEPSLFHDLVNHVERELVEEALRLTDGNQVSASRLLGLHRSTLRSKIGQRP